MITRRHFLQGTAAGIGALALPTGLVTGANAATSRNVLVVFFLRGGADGINLVIPSGDADYDTIRPTLAVPAAQRLPLDGFFDMNPSLSELQTRFQNQELAVLHAVGSPDTNRSHFDCQDFMERASPGDKSVDDGWLNRALAQIGGNDPLAGISMGSSASGALAGPAQNLSLQSIDDFALGGDFEAERRVALNALHNDPSTLLGERTAQTFSTIDAIASVANDSTVVYPDNSFGRRLRDIAALIRADIGVQVANISIGGWDNHDNQAAEMPGPMRGLSTGLDAFYTDLAGDASRVLTLVITEFGRTAEENGTNGTDHGRASVMLAMGGSAVGGQVHLAGGSWPGLAQTSWDRDLEVTTDFRNVFAEVLDKHLGVTNLAPIFPNFTAQTVNYPGILA